mgnify:FL=1|tara:strand:+ start:2843 stop:3115 length:273 start_codon:yes stop_codon:yes gene_type:complete
MEAPIEAREKTMTWKKTALICLWSLVAVAWLAVVAIYFTDPSKTGWIATVAGAAIVSEVAVWGTAGILGLSLLESRKRIWAKLTTPLRKP